MQTLQEFRKNGLDADVWVYESRHDLAHLHTTRRCWLLKSLLRTPWHKLSWEIYALILSIYVWLFYMQHFLWILRSGQNQRGKGHGREFPALMLVVVWPSWPSTKNIIHSELLGHPFCLCKTFQMKTFSRKPVWRIFFRNFLNCGGPDNFQVVVSSETPVVSVIFSFLNLIWRGFAFSVLHH